MIVKPFNCKGHVAGQFAVIINDQRCRDATGNVNLAQGPALAAILCIGEQKRCIVCELEVQIGNSGSLN